LEPTNASTKYDIKQLYACHLQVYVLQPSTSMPCPLNRRNNMFVLLLFLQVSYLTIAK
jgi:hypothetical protein